MHTDTLNIACFAFLKFIWLHKTSCFVSYFKQVLHKNHYNSCACTGQRMSHIVLLHEVTDIYTYMLKKVLLCSIVITMVLSVFVSCCCCVCVCECVCVRMCILIPVECSIRVFNHIFVYYERASLIWTLLKWNWHKGVQIMEVLLYHTHITHYLHNTVVYTTFWSSQVLLKMEPADVDKILRQDRITCNILTHTPK